MADYIRFNGDGIITKKYRSVDGADIRNNPDVLMVDRATLDSITRFHKVESGQVVPMTQTEIDAILQADANKEAQAIENQIQELQLTMKEVIIALIQIINVRIPNNPITRDELIQKIKDNRIL